MLRKVQRKLENLIDISADPEVLIVALSGGADSVCLLMVLKELQKKMEFVLEAIHVEHGIRGQESCDDAKFVENLCEELSVPCVVRHIDVPAYAKDMGLGTEEAARILRYQVFADYAKGCVCPKEFPVCVCGNTPEGKLINKGISATQKELDENNRSRSARLRTIERLR